MNNKIRIIIQDEIKCTLVGLSPRHVEYFYDLYKRRPQNYFFNPKFKLGQWDGYLRFFDKKANTYLYLLDEILPALTKLGYCPSIIDNRQSVPVSCDEITSDYFSHIPFPGTDNPTILQDHQVKGINSLLRDGSGLLLAATGSGKTLINTVLVDNYGNKGLKTLTIVPSTNLVLQTIEYFKHFGLDGGEYWANKKEIDKQHVVSTWQALSKNKHLVSRFDVLVIDEVHGAKGKQLQEMIVDHGRHIVHRFGLTGTLPSNSADSLTIQCTVGEVKYSIPAKELIKKGWLSQLSINMHQLVESDIDSKMFPDYASEKKFLQKRPERLNWIADLLGVLGSQRKGNTLCLINGIQLGKQLQQLIPQSVFIYGKDTAKTRQQVYDSFKDNNDLIVIATYPIASTGISINRIFNLVLIDPGKSSIRVIQSIGRGLRKAKDKNNVRVYDIYSSLKYSRRHASERRQFYNKEEYPNTSSKIKYLIDR